MDTSASIKDCRFFLVHSTAIIKEDIHGDLYKSEIRNSSVVGWVKLDNLVEARRDITLHGEELSTEHAFKFLRDMYGDTNNM